MEFFKRYNYIIVITFVVMTIISIGLFYLQFISSYNYELNQIRNKFEERVVNIDSMMKAVIDHINAMQITAQSYLTIHKNQSSPSLLFSQLKQQDSEQKNYALDNIIAPFSKDVVGNLTGIGSLKNRSVNFYREVEMALGLNPLFQATIHNTPNVGWVYYISAKKFINLYPWVHSRNFKFSEQLYGHEYYWLGLPEHNPSRQLFWSNAYINEAGKGLMVTGAVPVYENEEFLGTIALDFTLDILNMFVKNFTYQNSTLFVVNKKNQLLAHLNLIDSKEQTVKTVDMAFSETTRKHISQLFQSHPMEVKEFGSQLFVYQNLHNVPWKLVLWIPKQDIVFDSIYRTSWGFLVLLPGLVLMLFISTRLTRKEFIIPAGLLVKHIEDEHNGIDALIPNVPKGWRVWFETVSEIFQENKKINFAYSHFVPQQFLQILNKKSIVEVRLGEHVQQEMTILFADIRDFTSLSENMTPNDNFNFINCYLSQMEPVISQHNGFIDKYIGDAIMALFPNVDDAVCGAIAMLKTLDTYNEGRQRASYQAIKIGIGINTGLLMLGTIGGQNRMDGTVISDAVNLASRVEQLTKVYGTPLLISEYVYDKLADPSKYLMRIIDAANVKGKADEVTVYEVFDADKPNIIALKKQTLSSIKQGFVLYHCEQFNDARPFFTEVLQANPLDKVAQVYLERCQKILSMTMPDKPEILIVDNSFQSIELLSSCLAIGDQFEIVKAKDGEEALKIVEVSFPHLILLEVMMPGINGFEVCEQLKANPKTQNIPIIFVTTLSDAENKVKGFEVGGIDYITKPFYKQEILARVRTHLHLSHLQRQNWQHIKKAD